MLSSRRFTTITVAENNKTSSNAGEKRSSGLKVPIYTSGFDVRAEDLISKPVFFRRYGIIAALFAVAALCASPAGMAQYQDHDHYRTSKTSASALPPEMRIDINHATANELLKIPGMTPSWAGRIVRFRPYHTKLDLLDQGVVTSQVYDRIKDYVIAHRNKQ